jgi:hypothetical protein
MSHSSSDCLRERFESENVRIMTSINRVLKNTCDPQAVQKGLDARRRGSEE